MRAAVLYELGRPRCLPFDDPVAGDGQAVVEVAAAGLNHLDVAKASGGFYLGPPPLPSVVGSDGVGTVAGGRRVFFDETVSPYGSMAERTLVDAAALIDVPDGVDDTLAAALGNSGLAAWLALTWRARLQPGERVLVLGATGAVGEVAVQAARLLGAGRVVAAGRRADRLRRAEQLGADATVDVSDTQAHPAALREASGGGFDVIVDPLWGAPALAGLHAAAHGARFVQIGQAAGTEVSLPAPLVRGRFVSILGHANFHAPLEVRARAYGEMAGHAAAGDLVVDLERVPLRDVEAAWKRQAAGPERKLVIVP
jgi:NADPH:quinone reductase-like Zn-dependent oxidoreductase